LLRARAHGVAFKAGSRRLTIGVFSFSGSGAAAQALRSLRHGRRAVGNRLDGLLAIDTTARSTDVAIILRVGSATGCRAPAGARSPGARNCCCVAYAQSVAGRLRRVLALCAWQLTLDGIRADGSISTQRALQMFTLAYGPLPRVQRPAGPGGAPPSATLAMQLVAVSGTI
jgi:hypothetical protein